MGSRYDAERHEGRHSGETDVWKEDIDMNGDDKEAVVNSIRYVSVLALFLLF